jgi:hypothetical protein
MIPEKLLEIMKKDGVAGWPGVGAVPTLGRLVRYQK